MDFTQLGIEILDNAGLYLVFDVDKGEAELRRTRSLRGEAILAADEQGVVGIMCFKAQHGVLETRGTWVRNDRRREGIAELLWSLALTEFDVCTVEVEVISDRGLTLVENLRLKHPSLDWRVSHYGGRVLRVLAA